MNGNLKELKFKIIIQNIRKRDLSLRDTMHMIQNKDNICKNIQRHQNRRNIQTSNSKHENGKTNKGRAINTMQ